MDFLGFLGGLIGDIGDDLDAIITWATGNFNALWENDTGILGVIGSLAGWVWRSFSAIVSFLAGIWNWLRDHILARILAFLTDLFNRLRQFFKPLIDAIHRQQQMMMLIWNIYIKPVLNFIQALRRFLLIFRLLGFKWAKQLDAYLVALENKISLAFLGALQNLNILANWINFILDPFGLFQPIPLFGAIARSIGALIGLVWGGMNAVGFTGPSSAVTTPSNYSDYSVMIARVNLRAQVGLLPGDSELRMENALGFATLGYNMPLS